MKLLQKMNYLKIILSLMFVMFSIVFIIDLIETSNHINFPFEAGGFFYQSELIYSLKSLLIITSNLLPIIFLIVNKLRKFWIYSLIFNLLILLFFYYLSKIEF